VPVGQKACPRDACVWEVSGFVLEERDHSGRDIDRHDASAVGRDGCYKRPGPAPMSTTTLEGSKPNLRRVSMSSEMLDGPAFLS
jgi:hypothetical protein